MSDNDTNTDERAEAGAGRITYDQRDDAIEVGRSVAALTAIKNGEKPPEINDDMARQIGIAFGSTRRTSSAQGNGSGAGPAANSATGDAPNGPISSKDARRNRIRDGGGVGTSHQGTRDYWEVFGYPDPGEIGAEDYELWAARDDIASTLAYRPVRESWKNEPRVHDDGIDEDADPSDFELDLQSLFDSTENGKGLPYYWEWADWKQRTGDFGLLFIGLDDGEEMSEPINRGNLDSIEDVQYCNTFWQSDVVGWRVAGEFDADDPARRNVVRPDQPILYEIQFEHSTASGGTETNTNLVHHERVIHIVEEPTSSEWIGKSCLETHLNRLIDAEKVMGASAEAQYRNADRKYIGNAETDGTNGADMEMMEAFDEQMWELVNDMRTTAYTENMELDVIGGDNADPSGPLDALWPFFAGASGMPQRIMTGSERGDLASTQDQSAWYSRVGERQAQILTRALVRPTIDLLIWCGVIAPPVHPENEYTVQFPELFEHTELEQAEMSKTKAHAVKYLHDGIAAGADEQIAHDFAGIPLPDDDSGQSGSADPAQSVNWQHSDALEALAGASEITSANGSDTDPVEKQRRTQPIADGGEET